MLAAVKIAVCVKEVPEASSARRLDPSTLRLDRSGEGALNEFDAHALEEALKVKDGDAETEVVVLSMGPAKAAESMRKALAMGADRVVLVTDDGAAGSDLLATSAVLAAAIREGKPRPRAPRPAGRRLRRRRPLGRARRPAPAAARVAGGDARARRRARSSRSARPSTATTSSRRRCPRWSPSPTRSTSPATRRSRGSWARRRSRPRRSRWPTSAWTPARPAQDGSRTEVYSASPPPSRGDTERIEDDGGSSAEQIVAFLAERKLV